MKFKIGDTVFIKNDSIKIWDKYVPGCDYDKNREKALEKIGTIKKIDESYNGETVYILKVKGIYHHVAYVDKCIEHTALDVILEIEAQL